MVSDARLAPFMRIGFFRWLASQPYGLQRAARSKGLVRFNLLASVVNLTLNVVLAWLLIPPLGAAGAAWASVLPRLVSAVALNFAFASTRAQGVVMLRAMLAPALVLKLIRKQRVP
ncbi:MAG TPA: polysaccharide biosynthesis C-terminal domain-containing protein [Immundisolibacter sp.]|nr:polysaccharide biosynthesis C-terminal domain-containing protein [Immundisolibacter sp.]